MKRSSLEELFWKASVEEIRQGFIYSKEHKCYICLICGSIFEEGIVYPGEGCLLDARKATEIHIEKEHGNVFYSLLQLEKKYSGLSEIQRELLKDFYQGLSDKDIVVKNGQGSTSTIRNHRFKLKEKIKQAKVFLALMDIVQNEEPKNARYQEIKRLKDSKPGLNYSNLLQSSNIQGFENTKPADPQNLEIFEKKLNNKDISAVLENVKYMLITDIGSTTTKGLLVSLKKGKLNIIARANTNTTVEKPDEDVKIGIRRVAEKITDLSGISLLDKKGDLKIPYLSTSSAGGGLQVVVFGLTTQETGKLAELTALGAGAVIINSFATNDRLTETEKINTIRRSHPDMILMAGGIDGGGIWGTLRLAELLSLADPDPKFDLESKIPLVYCGNINGRNLVDEVLNEKFEIFFTDNIRPNMSETNIQPTRQQIHKLFMDNVMEKAPGYAPLKKAVIDNILPTPAGVEKILSLYTAKTKENSILFDVGGATTDIFSSIRDNFFRTVSANIGLSFSLANILKESGLKPLEKLLPAGFDLELTRNYIVNKTLNPDYLSENANERLIEKSCAILALNLSWKQHKMMNFQKEKIGILDKRRKSLLNGELNSFEENLKNSSDNLLFQESDIDTIIGSGGLLTTTSNLENLIIIAEGFKPNGLTKILVDTQFKSPHLGILSKLEPEAAFDLYTNKIIQNVGYVLAPVGKIKKDKVVCSIKYQESGQTINVKGGEFLLVSGDTEYEFSSSGSAFFGNKGKKITLKTQETILIDCRGRGEWIVSEEPLTSLIFKDENICDADDIISFIVDAPRKIDTKSFKITRKLPYRGEIFAEENKYVEADEVIGRNLYAPPKLYLLDIKRQVGFDVPVSNSDIENGLQIKEGQRLEKGQPFFSLQMGMFGGKKTFYSNVRGVVHKIEKGGMIILREIQDYNDKPYTFNIAELLNTSPKEALRRLKFQTGDYVEKGTIICDMSSSASLFSLFGGGGDGPESSRENVHKHFESDPDKIVKSPATGFITEITPSGSITIKYKIRQQDLKAFVNGRITHVYDKTAVDILTYGTRINGKIGFGNEACGELVILDALNMANNYNLEGKIVLLNKTPKVRELTLLNEAAIAGLIIPSISYSEWLDFFPFEIGVVVTGNEVVKYPVIITEGFGDIEINSEILKALKQAAGDVVSICGRTQIRAGVIRPLIILPGKEQ